MESAQPWREALRDDPGLERLVDVLAFAEGFAFGLLLCEASLVATTALQIAVAEMDSRKGQATQLIELRPYEDWQGEGPIPLERLVESVLRPLVEPGEAARSPDSLVAIHCGAARREEEQVWAELFVRMNQRRNVIMDRLGGALVLALPPWLEPTFAHAAPDFWSIRNVAAVIQVAIKAPVALRAVGPPPRLPPDAARRAGLVDALHSARARQAANAALAEDSLVSALLRLGYYALDRQEPDALSIAEECVVTARRLADREPAWTRGHYLLATALELLARVQRQVGDEAAADATAAACLALLRDRFATGPASVQDVQLVRRALVAGFYAGRHEQLASLNEQARALAAQGELGQAQVILDVALQAAQALQEDEPDYQGPLAVVAENLIAVLETGGHPEGAARLRRETLSRQPGSATMEMKK